MDYDYLFTHVNVIRLALEVDILGMDVKAFLIEFGLSDKEREVYLALLKGGAQPVRKVALSAGVNRGTTYDILKNLITQGLVTYHHKEKRQYFIAEDPEVFAEALKDKEKNISNLRQQLNEIVPQMRSLYDSSGGKPVVRYYEGVKGVNTILGDVLDVAGDNGKEYAVYSTADLRPYLHAAYPTFTEERIRRGVKVRVIAIGEGGQLKGLDERRWLSKKTSVDAPTYSLIYNNKIALLSVGADKQPFGMIIEDPGISATQKYLFDWTWRQLS